jgi:hypothetical protein
MGVLVPVTRLVEMLEYQDIKDSRTKAKQEREQNIAAALQSIPVESLPKADNPDHKEDFTRLANAAMKKQPQDD